MQNGRAQNSSNFTVLLNFREWIYIENLCSCAAVRALTFVLTVVSLFLGTDDWARAQYSWTHPHMQILEDSEMSWRSLKEKDDNGNFSKKNHLKSVAAARIRIFMTNNKTQYTRAVNEIIHGNTETFPR